jgi:hypothetical protein
VLAREEKARVLAAEIPFQGSGVAVELGGQVVVGRFADQLEGGLEVRGAGQEALPQVGLGAQAIGFAEDLLGRLLVVPEIGFPGQFVEMGDAVLFGPEVKDAPKSTGPARRGPGWRTYPPSSGPGDRGARSGGAR